MQAGGINQVQLAERTGLAVSRVNNYLHGNYRTINPAHLSIIVQALDATPADTAALIQAYLFDLLPDACRGLIEILPPSALKSERWKMPSKGLPPEFARSLTDLYILCASSAAVRRRTAGWIEIMRETQK